MKILAAADIHGDRVFYENLPESALNAGAEAVVLAGDLLGYPDGYPNVESAQRADATHILALLEPSEVPILFVMGNDDFAEFASDDRRVRSVHGLRIDVGRYNFVGYQYALPFMGGTFEKTDEAIAQDLASIAALVDRETVLVTHSPAYGIRDKTILGGHAGSRSIRDLVVSRDPRAHIHGHIHHGFGRRGRHFNVATDGTRRAMVIDLDTMGHKVVRLPI